MPALRWLTTATTAALLIVTAQAAPASSTGVTPEAQDAAPIPAWSAQQNCTRSTLEAGVLDCFYQGELVHVHTSDNHTQVQAPGTVVWNDASTGDVEVRAPGFGLTCVTVKEGKRAGEQRCHIETAWWDSESPTPTPAAVLTSAAADEAIPTTTSTTTITKAPPSPTPTFSFLRGGSRALDVVANGEQTRVAGPLTAVAVNDCQETEKGRNCTYVDGRWTSVATTEEGATHVTAPGVDVRTTPKEVGGSVNVDAWGFHIACRKDPATNKTKCHTTNDWFGNGEGARGGEATPLPEVEEVPRVGGEDDVPDPVMHLHPRPPQVEGPSTVDVVAGSSSSSGSVTSYLNNGGRPSSPPLGPAVDPLPTPPTDLVDPMFSVPVPTGTDPGTTIEDATVAGWEATTPIPDDNLMPRITIDLVPTPAEMGMEAAMEEVDAPMFVEPRKEVSEIADASSPSFAVGAGGVFEPFPGVSSTAAAASSSSSLSSSSSAASPSLPDPRDPAWLSNSKNCTRAIKGEGKDCWVDGRWVHVRTGVAEAQGSPAAAAAAATDASTATTEVTAPGVVVQADNSTGVVEVRAPGVRITCRRDASTGEDKCTTTTAWTDAKEGEEEQVEKEGKEVVGEEGVRRM